MTKRMLIDATHAEETRVVVLDGNRLEDFDVETQARRQLKGNIYLAKVVRVEPSLQAAFVEYGGNRHGFLAFGEIHPDYYQIPVADRQRLLAMQEEDARAEAEAEDAEDAAIGRRAAAQGAARDRAIGDDGGESTFTGAADDQPSTVFDADADDRSNPIPAETNWHSQPLLMDLAQEQPPLFADSDEPQRDLQTTTSDHITDTNTEFGADCAPEFADAAQESSNSDDHERSLGSRVQEVQGEILPPPETVGGDSDQADEQMMRDRREPPRFLRNYKIQEVIRRRQIMLIQVVKEERGSKGAALTTYISLAGRYSVLMPNSPRGGGISRKITSATDRRRLKEVTSELEIPRGMGLIVRTAGANRPKPEIKRDCEYLLRLWDEIRDLTLRSVAPALIYEEASLIKRAIRDVYSRDVDEIIVDGEDGWKAARDFMRMLMPTHAKKVQLWRGDGQKLFARSQVEAQLDAMLSPTVQLRSGGYLVINQAEALVAIDVNSGRSTRERGIEETALRTNMEAAEEVARQLRLRDLAGLIVIDFIDMESKRNNAAVERRLKESLKNDRARIQVGHISHFGLMEMSRQRLRPSIAETSMIVCPHCAGTGHVRSTETAALFILRAIEEEGSKRRAAEILVHTHGAIALYILNNKRDLLDSIEARFGMRVCFAADDTLLPDQSRIDKIRAALPMDPNQTNSAERRSDYDTPFVAADENDSADSDDADINSDDDADCDGREPPARATGTGATAESEAAEAERGRRRRRRRRGGRNQDGSPDATALELGEQPDVTDAAFPVLANGTMAVPMQNTTRPPELQRDAEPAETGGTESARPESARGESGRDRPRRRRGGRRNRAAGPDEAANVAVEDEEKTEFVRDPAPMSAAFSYSGPTPADPFANGGGDIFDVLEQAEEARHNEAAVSANATRENEDTAPPPRAALPVRVHKIVEAPVPLPGPSPSVVTTPALQVVEAVVGPVIQPVLLNDTPADSDRKKGWWRR